ALAKDSADSTSTVAPAAATYKDLSDVKNEIIGVLFHQKYKPDSAFIAQFDSTADSAQIAGQWIYYANKNFPEFFMKQFYKEKYNQAYPNSVSELLGDGKILGQKDLDLILSWLPEGQRESAMSEDGKKNLVEWLLKWQLMSEVAAKSGFTSTKVMKERMEWAYKIALACKYLEEEVIAKVNSSPVKLDTSVIEYVIYDELGTPSNNVTSSQIDSKIKAFTSTFQTMKIDSIIYSMRKEIGVEFLQNDIKDDLVLEPSALLRQADSLRDTSNVKDAEQSYGTLVNNFPLTPEGKKAFVELAKLQTEKQQYHQAIRNYRNFLIMDGDSEKRCNTFFMIGFIYDEYLNISQQAEVNYKWILKNARDCELADDAEFMLLHLDEPMNSVEELQAEAIRQGRKLEPLTGETEKSAESK
ncbi:MAG: hypothetical protein Q4F84_09155, partial [Fibrobacter sp.]|nr:hypothetical protein [Fibrobacter sp.]